MKNLRDVFFLPHRGACLRWQQCIGTFVFIFFWCLCPKGNAAISVGGRVSVTQNGVNVRAGAGSTTINGTQNSGALGTVIGGPTNAQIGGTGTTYTWWNINFDTGADGWVASIYLAEVPAPTMGLNSPNAGATWQVGTSQTVSWSISGDTAQISYFVVRLSTNGGSSYTDISSNLNSSTRSFNYTPTASQASTSAVCWVRAFNSSGTFVAGAISSGNFTITNPPPTMTLTAPNAGATWQVGSSQTVSWTASGNTSQISYFVVRLSTNSGSSYTDISSNLSSSTRSFSYTPTANQASTNAVCWVRAFNSSGTFLAGAISSGNFTITNPPPTMTLTAPNAGATWQVGSSQTVSWTASGNTSQISYFVVRLSTNDGSSYTDISSNLNSSTRSFNYTPSAGQASSNAVCWVRAFDSSGTFLAGAISSGNFTITNPPPTMTLTAPNAGATWRVGTSQTVSWTATGNTSQISYFVVRLSTNGGNSYTDISSNLDSLARSFNYTPTANQASANAVCWVRAFNSSGTFLAGAISSGNFAIINSTTALSITSTAFNPATAMIGSGYAAQQALAATGGTKPYSWSASGFPNGMAINSSTGAPFGTPTVGGNFNVAVTIRDSGNPQQIASKTLPLSVSTATIRFISLQGPTSVPSGGSAAYSVQGTYSDGTTSDVTNICRIQFSGAIPSFAGIGGNTLFINAGTLPTTVQLTASYSGPTGQILSPILAVSITQPFVASATGNAQYISSANYTVTLNGSASGGTTPYTFNWDTNNDGTYGDRTGSNTSYTLSSQGGTYRIGLKVVDSSGASAYTSLNVVANKPAVPGEPPVPTSDLAASGYLAVDGVTGYSSDPSKASNGFLVITHGIQSTVRPSSGQLSWASNLAQAIQARLADKSPNILLYDWSSDAYAVNTGIDLAALRQSLTLSDLGVLNLFPFASTAATLLSIITDAELNGLNSRFNTGPANGRRLASWISDQISHGVINPNAPMQLIGHSAGGFVVGECSERLAARGFLVDMFTMLDTPVPIPDHIQIQTAFGFVERYESSVLGLFNMNLPYIPVVTNGHYFIDPEFKSPILLNLFNHPYAHDWYQESVSSEWGVGFNRSPFVSSSQRVNKGTMMKGNSLIARLRSSDHSAVESSGIASSLPDQPLTGFIPFGSVAQTNGGFVLTENADSGITQQLQIPIAATSLKFRYQFTNPGDGDFLSVTWANSATIYYGEDLTLSETGFVEAEIPLNFTTNLNGVLTFTLVSRGNPNAVIDIEDIRFAMSDDVDSDGLTNEQEAALGTDPRKADTDGDGISDGDEVNTYQTNPSLADSDGDGMNDSNEITAGTDPKSAASVFRASLTHTSPSGGFTITWTGSASATYSILRSADVTFGTYDVVATGISGNVATYADTSIPAGTTSIFYRVRLELNSGPP